MMNILANNGAINNMLAVLGFDKYQFLTDKKLIRASVSSLTSIPHR